jgi:xanthine dehydrogenase accessory factor
MLDATEIVPRSASAEEVLAFALDARRAHARVAIATVVERQGSAPSTPGQKLAVALRSATGALREQTVDALGTIGGGAVERAVIDALLAAAVSPSREPRLDTFRLGPSLGMCCGGSVRVLVESLRPAFSVVLAGGGHVGRSTAKVLSGAGFRVVVVDGRHGVATRLAEELAASPAIAVIGADFDDPEAVVAMGDPAETAFVAMTHDHLLDQRVVEWALDRGFAFVGGVGSRAKAERTRQRLAARGRELAPDALHMPVGLAIDARLPEEIAIAIAAQLIEFRARFEGRVRGAKAEARGFDTTNAEGAPRRENQESAG